MDFEKQFKEPWNDSDVIFVVEGIEFHVHSLILKMTSPVLSVMFSGIGFKEGREMRAELPGKDKNAFYFFLTYLYPQSRYKHYKDCDFEIWYKIVEYAKEYAADGVITVVDQILAGINIEALKDANDQNLSKILSRNDPFQKIFKNWQDIFAFSDKHMMGRTKKRCIKLLEDLDRGTYSYDDKFLENLTSDVRSELLTVELNKMCLLEKTEQHHKRDRDVTVKYQECRNLAKLLSKT